MQEAYMAETRGRGRPHSCPLALAAVQPCPFWIYVASFVSAPKRSGSGSNQRITAQPCKFGQLCHRRLCEGVTTDPSPASDSKDFDGTQIRVNIVGGATVGACSNSRDAARFGLACVGDLRCRTRHRPPTNRALGAQIKLFDSENENGRYSQMRAA